MTEPIERLSFRRKLRSRVTAQRILQCWFPGAPRNRVALAASCCGLMLGLCASTLPAAAQAPVTQIKVALTDSLGPLEIGRMALGQGGLSSDPIWAERVPEIRALRPRLIRLFIQEYFNLLPERGHPQFDTLDRAVQPILQAGAQPLMCICFKPRVLFPSLNQDVVEPNDYAEWERLVSSLVKHYRDRGAGIRYWEVANEPDIGEDGGCPYRFKPDSYARYYQHTVAAILRADPEARVGGPALASASSPILPALLDFCEKEKTALHFVSWHIYSSDPRAIRGTIERVQALLKKHPALHPETFLDEWNMALDLPPTDPRLQPCFVAETIWQMKDAGLDYSCYYHIRDYHVAPEEFTPFMSPHGVVFMANWWNRKAQFDGLFDFQNNIRPTYFLFKLLSRLTGERLSLRSTRPSVHGLAAHDRAAHLRTLLLWNYSASPVELGITLDALAGEVRAFPLLLDASASAGDENTRLRPEPVFRVKPEKPVWRASLEPYGVRFWSLE